MRTRGPYRPRAGAATEQEAPQKDPRQTAIDDAQRALYAAKRALKVKQARGAGWESLRAFCELMWPDPEDPDNPDASLFECEPHHKILLQMVADIEARKRLRAACSMPPQHGKAVALDTPVPTPDGWRRIVDLRPGDFVFSETGAPCRVVAVSPVWRRRPVFFVRTDDGDEIIADENHEWVVRLCRKRPVFKTKTTRELAERKSARAPMVQAQGPLDLPDAELPIDPYVLGAWLGDGCTDSATMCTVDQAIVDRVAAAEGARVTKTRSDGVMYFIPGRRHGDFSRKLRTLRVMGDKHVPAAYLRASSAQRRALLQGLIDTNGHVAPDGQVEFCSTRLPLALAVRELVASLGGKARVVGGRATLDGRDCGPKYRVLFYMADAAWLPRKAERCRTGVKSDRRYLTITPAGVADTVCIEVDSPNRMFLVGRSMLPTHNSQILSRLGIAWVIGRNPHWRVLFATYADNLAETRGDELRTTLESDAFREVFPKVALKAGSRSKTEMVFTAGGSVNLVGRGTGTTGRPCDLFVIDDPYKDDEEASSETIREKVRTWYSGVAQTRCPVWAPILIVHTRWNEDDLIGWLTDPAHPSNRADPERPKRWTYVNLPSPVNDDALAAALGLPVGSALWPRRFPLHHLAEIKANDARLYAALYMGQPAPEDGDFFRANHFHTYLPHELPKVLRIYAASDHAVSEKQRADWTVLGTVGVCEQNIVWVLPDLFWEQAPTDKVVEAMLDMAKRQPPLWWRAGRDHITKAIGPFLRKRMQERNVFVNVIEEPEAGDKVRKAQAIQARMAAGAVRFPAGAPWYVKARAEMLKFPHAKHDDFVDFMSLIGRGLRTLNAAAAPAAANDALPKTNTIRWIKWAAQQDRLASARDNRLSTM